MQRAPVIVRQCSSPEGDPLAGIMCSRRIFLRHTGLIKVPIKICLIKVCLYVFIKVTQ